MNLDKKQPLKDFGQIQLCQNYLKVEAEKNLKQQKKLVFNKHFVEREEYCIVNRNVDNGYICFYEKKSSEFIYYLHLLLDSFIGRMMLYPEFASNVNVFKGQVTLKRLRDFPVITPSPKVINAGICLDLSIKTIINLGGKENDRLFLESAKYLMEELRDDFVMELYANDLFVGHNITIVEPLVEVVDNCRGMSLNEVAVHIMQSITAPDGTLLSNIRRFRVLLSSLNPKDSL